MKYHLHKMHGCGNDFLFIDAIQAPLPCPLTKETVIDLCDRHFGIGADGVAILEKGYTTDARWTFFNSDGSQAEMCGNAARCAIRYLADQHFSEKPFITLQTLAGSITGRKLPQGGCEIALTASGESIDYEEKLIKQDGRVLRVYSINTGVPHAVLEVENITDFPITSVGQFLVHHGAFGAAGTNVTFFQPLLPKEILSTTFERGVNKETFACGTGVVAAALMYSQLHLHKPPIRVHVPGGTLEVNLDPQSKRVLLSGPAEYLFEADYSCCERLEKRPLLFNERVPT